MGNKKNETNKSNNFSFFINYQDSEIKSLAKINVKGSYVSKTEVPDDMKEKVINTLQSSMSEYMMLNDIKKLSRLQAETTEIIQYAIQKIKIHGINIESIKFDSIEYADETKELVESQTKKTNEPQIVKTDKGAKDGQNRCPKCGSTEITTNVKTGKLRCNYCRHEFEPEKIEGMVTDLNMLEGQIIGSGAQDIIADTKDILTFKCSSCGAEVVIDTASAPQARCHWCRHTLSVNQQIPNGSIPDVVLPFNIEKDVARAEIEKFVGKRKFYAHPQFKKEFTTENIMGVYFPYMLVDVNAHATLVGEGEHQTRKYYVKEGDHERAYYDADAYHVERDFDITINELSVESSSDRLNKQKSDKTNNIINSIMPFDTENCVKFNANYLKGYTSEKRDLNIDELRNLVATQSKDIARFAANETLEFYDRGVAWSSENLTLKGQQWKSAYLPVWLYSYQEVKGAKKLLHYVAVNARTKETMGSVPIHMPKLLLISFLVELLGFLAMIFLSDSDYNWIFLLAGFVYFFIIYAKYRNTGARHTYETETKKQMLNIQKKDEFFKKRTGLSNSRISGANNRTVNGANMDNTSIAKNIGSNILNSTIDNNPLASFVKNNINNNKGGKK